MKKIRVLLVDDSLLALTVLQKMLATAPDVEVVGAIQSGMEALKLIPRLDPAVICTDLHMPGMTGLEFTRRVMESFPRPILAVSISVQKHQDYNIFSLLEAGAVDVFPKPLTGEEAEYRKSAGEFIDMIRILAGVSVFRRRGKGTPLQGKAFPINSRVPPRMVVIGASSGGPVALMAILSRLPADYPAPIICIQHIVAGFLQELAEWLAGQCLLRVKIAEPGEYPARGIVYLAPENTHLGITANGSLQCNSDAPVEGHRPSVTVTFRSAARYYGQNVWGILLTGMGRDGAEGLLDIANAGGVTIAQDEGTSLIFGMPGQAVAIGAAKYVLPLDRIADVLRTSAFFSPS